MEKGPSSFTVGTLTYSKKQLAWLFFWLLLGDFSMSVMAVSLAKLLPMHLDSIGVSPMQIAWTLSLGPLVALAISPFIGVWSDRLRTRWGRRRPFLLVSTPILAGGLLLIPHIKSYPILCVVILIVQVANVLETVLYYLFADVIPAGVMGRFMAAFRVVGTLGALAFQTFLYPRFDESPVMVWTICAGVYLVFYQLSLFFVHEGKYDPPKTESRRELAKDYVKDGFGSRYIWTLWLALGMIAITSPAGAYMDLFGKKELGLDMQTIAKINAYATIPTLFLIFCGGWIIDRSGPRVIWGVFSFALGISNLLGYFFVKDAATMQIFYLSGNCLNSLLATALMPMLYAHLPKARFGQLVSAQSVVVQSFIFLSANAVGWVIASVGGGYRTAIIYMVPFYLLVPVFIYLIRFAPNPFKGEEFAMQKRKSVTPQKDPQLST